MDTPIVRDGDEDFTLSDSLPSDEANHPDSNTEEAPTFAGAHAAIADAAERVLTSRELEAHRMRMFDDMTLNAIGEVTGVTRERTR